MYLLPKDTLKIVCDNFLLSCQPVGEHSQLLPQWGNSFVLYTSHSSLFADSRESETCTPRICITFV